MLKRCLEELEVDTKRYPPRAVRARISDAKNQLIDAESYQNRRWRSARSRRWSARPTACMSGGCSRPTRWTSTTC